MIDGEPVTFWSGYLASSRRRGSRTRSSSPLNDRPAQWPLSFEKQRCCGLIGPQVARILAATALARAAAQRPSARWGTLGAPQNCAAARAGDAAPRPARASRCLRNRAEARSISRARGCGSKSANQCPQLATRNAVGRAPRHPARSASEDVALPVSEAAGACRATLKVQSSTTLPSGSLM